MLGLFKIQFEKIYNNTPVQSRLLLKSNVEAHNR